MILNLGFRRTGCLQTTRTEAKMLCMVLDGRAAPPPGAAQLAFNRPVTRPAATARLPYVPETRPVDPLVRQQ
jgi:hypothetical protein